MISPLSRAVRLSSGGTAAGVRKFGLSRPPRTGLPVVVVLVSMMCGSLAWGVTSASAALTRPLVSSFDGTGSTAGVFAGVDRVAVNQTNGNVFVLDRSSAIDQFDASGTAQTFSGLSGATDISTGGFGGDPDVAVDNSGTASDGNIYFSSEGQDKVYGFDSTGAALPGFPLSFSGDICGVGVDPSGDLWVANYSSGLTEYDSAGQTLSGSFSGQGYCHFAFDSSGDLYLAAFNGEVEKWDPNGSGGFTKDPATPVLDPGPAKAVDVDPATGHVFVTHPSYVSEYDASGALVDNFGQNTLQNAIGIAVNSTTGEAYVSDDTGTGLVDVFGSPSVTVADVSTGSAASVTTTSATLTGTVNPDGLQLTDCHFEYGATTSYGQTAPCVPAAGSIAADSNDHQVTAQVSGLTPDNGYHYRLVATDANGLNFGADQAFATGAAIDAEGTQSVGTDTATVTAQINPDGAAAGYHVEYGTTTSYGASVPVPDAGIGSGSSDVAVTQKLTGLKASTTYHYRVVATDSGVVADGPDRMFTTFGPAPTFASCPNDSLRYGYGAVLPDCRAYEQATPVNKDGTNPTGGIERIAASPDGTRVLYFVPADMQGAQGSSAFPYFLSTRTDAGWSTEGVSPPAPPGSTLFVMGWSPDLKFIVLRTTLAGDASPEIYLENTTAGTFQRIASTVSGSQFYTSFVDGFSADDSTVYFESTTPLLAAAGSGDNVYAWNAATGLRLADLLPASQGGGTPPGGGFAGSYDVLNQNPGAGGAVHTLYTRDAISADGRDLVFTASGGEIYQNRDGTSVDVSASQRATPDPNGPQPAAFMDASRDGSLIIFTSPAELTDNANTGSADQGNDLYVYDVGTQKLTDISLPNAGVTDTNPSGADVVGVLGASQDGSYVYFAANGVLANGASLGNCAAVVGLGDGACSIYVWHDGQITFVARTNTGSGPGPGPNGEGQSLSKSDPSFDWTGEVNGINDILKTGFVTPDGTSLLFSTWTQLTGYDNAGYDELYRYNTLAGSLTCVSCDPSGAVPSSDASLQSISAAFASPNSPAPFLTHNLSDSGDQVFFESSDPLVPQATNGVQNVYEWEADGAGSCTTDTQDHGCIYLISSGTSPDPSYFLDASASGDDVFFFTSQGLVGQDQDDLVDVYDARVDGGLSSQNPPAAASPCTEVGTCRGTAAGAPQTPAAGTAGFAGPADQRSAATSTHGKLAKVKLGKVTMVSGHLRVGVRIPARGSVRITGTGLKATTKREPRAGSFTITVTPTGAESKRLASAGKRMKLRVRIAYRASAGGGSSVATTISVSR